MLVLPVMLDTTGHDSNFDIIGFRNVVNRRDKPGVGRLTCAGHDDERRGRALRTPARTRCVHRRPSCSSVAGAVGHACDADRNPFRGAPIDPHRPASITIWFHADSRTMNNTST
jgi:hypothetical protein